MWDSIWYSALMENGTLIFYFPTGLQLLVLTFLIFSIAVMNLVELLCSTKCSQCNNNKFAKASNGQLWNWKLRLSCKVSYYVSYHISDMIAHTLVKAVRMKHHLTLGKKRSSMHCFRYDWEAPTVQIWWNNITLFHFFRACIGYLKHRAAQT